MNHHLKFPSSNGQVAHESSGAPPPPFSGSIYAMNHNLNNNMNRPFNMNRSIPTNNSCNDSALFASANNTTNSTVHIRNASSKRRSSNVMTSGRSLKRLRLDHVQIPPGGVFSSAHSVGTLSVGTMGGDLESNDEDLGEEEEDETEDGRHGGAGAGGGGESVGSSWVASLESGGNYRKRRIGTAGAAAVQAASLRMLEDDADDAATCSGMTTAAVAPRRRRPHHAHPRKRRAIGFTTDPHRHDDDDALDLEELDPPSPAGAFAGDARECCSSVTEEDASLAEDEASISAISIGANTTVSALSGGMEPPCAGGGGAYEPAAARAGDPAGVVGLAMDGDAGRHPYGQHLAAHGASAGGGYAPLNHILGGLHKDRLSRLSTHRPHSRGEASLRSTGSSEGSGGGATYRSLPGALPAAGHRVGAGTMLWNVPSKPRTPLAMDDDAEMEDAGAGHHPHERSVRAAVAAAAGGSGGHGRGGSVGTLSHGSRSTGASVGSDTAVAPYSDPRSTAAETPAHRWQRRVNLPSHSSLY